ncbi:MAG: hypothetical protein AB1428_12760 [Bacteroidota bacterium]
MKTTLAMLVAALCAAYPLAAQQSDLALKKSYEARYKAIENRLDSASTLEELDSLRNAIQKLGEEYSSREAFLDKALYPTTFLESISRLRTIQVLTYDRVYLITTQGLKVSELEARVASLTTRLDSLTAQRDQLFGELQESRKSMSTLREAVKRLTANLEAKDRLIFALVDSIFVPYGKDLQQVADVHKEAIGQKLEKANVVTRVYEIASDNVKFLEVTQLQGRDYANLIDQYQTFRSRWSGLKEKMADVAATSAVVPAVGKGGSKGPAMKGGGKEMRSAAAGAASQAEHVDSVLNEWQSRLSKDFWGGLQKEFTAAGVAVAPFNDGPSFSNSIRTYVATLKGSTQDPGPFVDIVWKQRIDREWRDALTKESMLGKTEYAALDKLVSEVSKETIDLTLVLYLVAIVVVIAAIWFFVFRKKAPEPTQETPQQPS